MNHVFFFGLVPASIALFMAIRSRRIFLIIAASLIVIAGIMNFSAMAANNGKMPAKNAEQIMQAFKDRGIVDKDHVLMTENSRLKPLCDIYGTHTRHIRYSLGDVLLTLGLLVGMGYGTINVARHLANL